MYRIVLVLFFFFKQKTAYEMRISDWSSDVCSSDLIPNVPRLLDRRMMREFTLGWTRNLTTFKTTRKTSTHRCSSCRGRRTLCSARSEERRVGKECASTCSSRWSTYH